MDAKDAAAALQDAAGYEESLTQRTAGMTNIVWGLAAPLIFLTYGAAGELTAGDKAWLLAILWIPGAALGGVLTATLWSSHAVTMQREVTRGEGWNHLGMNILIFVVLAATLAALSTWTQLDWNMSVVMVIVNGMFAFIVARREAGASLACSRHTMVAGAFMMLAGIALGWMALGEPGSSLGGAAVTAIGWAGSGIWTYARS